MEDETKEFSADLQQQSRLWSLHQQQPPHRGYLSKNCGLMEWLRVKKKIISLLDPESTRIPSLMDLTEQDYAVNTPSAGKLLQGSELLKALECPPTINL